MAVKIRLTRLGDKKNPFYRIVVADSRSPRDGRFIDVVGTYDPVKSPAEIKVDEAKAKEWLGKGAQPTDTVRDIFVNLNILEKKAVPAKTNAIKKKKND